jgi:hypothetical protein
MFGSKEVGGGHLVKVSGAAKLYLEIVFLQASTV